MTKSQFFRYLKEKGIYAKWFHYLNIEMNHLDRFLVKERFNTIKKFIDFYIGLNLPEEIIMNSFSWCETNEGENFWSYMDKEIRLIKNGEKNIEECYV